MKGVAVAVALLIAGVILDLTVDATIREPQEQAEQRVESRIASAANTLASCEAVAAIAPERIGSLVRAGALLAAAREHYEVGRYDQAEKSAGEAVEDARANGCPQLQVQP